MRLTLIKIAVTISFMAIFLPQMASANASPSFSCSSNLVVSLHNGYQASCDGDFTFTDGVLENEVSISLIAGGLLNIGANASLSAPIVQLTANNIQVFGKVASTTVLITPTVLAGEVSIDKSAIQNNPKAILNWAQFQLNSGADVEFGTSNTTGVIYTSVGGNVVLGDISGLVVNTKLTDNFALFVTQVPEPSTYAMMILGLASIRLSRKPKTN